MDKSWIKSALVLDFRKAFINNEMQLSETGKFAEQFWMDIPSHFQFVELGNFVIMPNHTHGKLIIDKSNMPIAQSNGSVDTGVPVGTPKMVEPTNTNSFFA